MKKMTKWLAVCAVCVMGSVPPWQLTEAVIVGLKSEAEYMIRCSQRRRAIMDILAWDMDPMDCIRKEE